jgi:hypothetical protein
MDNITNLPGAVALDLDSMERPAKDIKPPFRFVVAEREITMLDPAEIDWRDLITLESPMQFINFTMSQDDRTFLLAQDLPGWKFNQLMDAYYRHYDLESLIRNAQREQRMSGI